MITNCKVVIETLFGFIDYRGKPRSDLLNIQHTLAHGLNTNRNAMKICFNCIITQINQSVTFLEI